MVLGWMNECGATARCSWVFEVMGFYLGFNKGFF